MSHKYLILNDRNKIEVLNAEGYSSRRIAKILASHHSTIAREIKRCNGPYDGKEADQDNKYKSSFRGRKTKITRTRKNEILDKLNSKWSPEQIAFIVLEGVLCFKRIDNWLYSGLIDFGITRLRGKARSRKAKETRGKFHVGTSIKKG